MQVAVCQICKYPVWSYICPDCLAGEIGKWLPRELSGGFREFSRSFLAHFSSIESNLTQTRCLHCRTMKEATLCSFCYVAEVFQWLHEKDRRLARTLFMALPLDASLKATSGMRSEWSEIKPISCTGPGIIEEICEECGENCETQESEGRRLCSVCAG
jgi:hypothetical protein